VNNHAEKPLVNGAVLMVCRLHSPVEVDVSPVGRWWSTSATEQLWSGVGLSTLDGQGLHAVHRRELPERDLVEGNRGPQPRKAAQ
jgi:hypothetical protein